MLSWWWRNISNVDDVVNIDVRSAKMIKALRETQHATTARWPAEPRIFAPPQTPFPGVQDGQSLLIRI